MVNATQWGVQVPPNDPRALADGIAQLVDNEPPRRQLGQRGRLAVERNFTAERMADATVDVYQQLLHARQLNRSLRDEHRSEEKQ